MYAPKPDRRGSVTITPYSPRIQPKPRRAIAQNVSIGYSEKGEI